MRKLGKNGAWNMTKIEVVNLIVTLIMVAIMICIVLLLASQV